ncbi:4Fe-4S binding protein [candidate division FCPU426 bacterium]|nr:4Fe-4S binding protein [candidate division FCPU426 bacterium]
MRKFRLLVLILVLAAPGWPAVATAAEERFPAPEFETQYEIPTPAHPHPRQDFFEYLDIAVLLAALGLAAFFAIKKRSRLGLFSLTFFSILYFGFFRHGCICPVGALQNVIFSFSGDYLLPLGVILFFALPLLFALFFGRVFCASVCPLGALQEAVIYKPIRLPQPIKHVLGLIPYLYLGLAVLFASTGSGFVICRFDPFVGFYRLSATPFMLLLGLGLLLTGIFIARPYCRFFCPYGVLLGIFSFFAKKHLSITPKECIHCRLCENACPVDAINPPSPRLYKTSKAQQIKHFGIFLAFVPLILATSGFGFSRLTDVLARQDRMVSLAERIHQEETNVATGNTLDSDAFRQEQTRVEDLYRQAARIRHKFYIGLWVFGLFFGLVISLKIIVLMQRPGRTDYTPDRFHCISCGRCMEYCPVQSDGSVTET